MNWLGFSIALVLTYFFQTTLAALAPAGSLDLFLVLTLVAGFLMPIADARLAGWLAGFVQSLETAGPVGAHAFSLGLSAWLQTMLRDSLNMRSHTARFLAAMTGAVAGQGALRLYQYLLLGHVFESWGEWTKLVLVVSLVAAIAATIVSALVRAGRRRRRSLASNW